MNSALENRRTHVIFVFLKHELVYKFKVKQGSANIPSVSADIVMDFYKEYVCDFFFVRVCEIYEKN